MTPDEYAGRCTRFLQAQPHMRKLGVELVDAEASRVTLRLPVNPELVSGGLETYLHGGVLTTLVDAASSVSTLCALEAFELCPTLDLRIDHMRIPSETRPVYVDAECYRITRSVLFTRASVYQDDKSRLVANAVATFMRPEGGAVVSDFQQLIEGAMMQQLLEMVKAAHASGDYQPLVDLIPYARMLGVECACYGEEIIFKLPANPDTIGNPTIPAIHGGVIAAFMELTAQFQLTLQMPQPGLAKVIDFSLDYMRAGLHRDTFAICTISRQGRRIGNCSVLAWQERKSRPIAQARAHFLLDASPIQESAT